MNSVKARWQEILLSRLPPEQEVEKRNLAIDATYAGWCLAHPDWFRWAGMAAFASHRVGLLLSMYDFTFAGDRVTNVLDTFSEGDKAPLLNNIEILRRANNLAFANSGWAHLAYAAPDGGIDAVEAGLGDDPTQVNLLEGFRLIETGRRLLASSSSNAARADAIFWRGNFLLLKHEQWGVIQHHFEQLHMELDLFLTLTTVLHFDANELVMTRWTRCSFFSYMWTRGLVQLLLTLSLPNIKLLRHRWAWVSGEVFPTWQKVVTQDRRLRFKLMAIARPGSRLLPAA